MDVTKTPASSCSTGMCVVNHVVVSADELKELPRPVYECELCGLRVKTKANLRAHHVKTHRIIKSDSDVAFYTKQKNTISYVYHCPVVPCKHNIGRDGGFASCSRLKQHFQNVHMSKSYACGRCKQLFPTPSAQAYHMKLCGRIYTCSVCSKIYRVKKLLMQHFRRSGHCPDNKTRSRSREPLNSDFSQENSRAESSTATTSNNASSFSGVAPSQLQQPTWIPVLIVPIPVPTFSDNNDIERKSCTVPFLDSFISPMLLPGPKVHQSIAADTPKPKSDLISQFPTEEAPPEYATSQWAECSTQTLGVDAAVDTTAVGSCSTSVSVNIGTDDDDISAFLGSLFCDASVETKFPMAQLVHEFTDTGLDSSHSLSSTNPASQYVDAAFDTEDLPDNSGTALILSENRQTVTRSEEDTKINDLMAPFSSDEAQPGSCVDVQGWPATHNSFAAQQTYFPASRPLETPPPMRSQNPSQLLSVYRGELKDIPHENLSSLEVHCDSRIPPSVPKPLLSVQVDPSSGSNEESSYPYSDLSTLESKTHSALVEQHVPSFQSVGLQSNLWSPSAPLCTSMETQTMDADLESWLNSVHTQTSSSPFDLHGFADMAVGVDEDFLTSALCSVEADSKYPN